MTAKGSLYTRIGWTRGGFPYHYSFSTKFISNFIYQVNGRTKGLRSKKGQTDQVSRRRPYYLKILKIHISCNLNDSPKTIFPVVLIILSFKMHTAVKPQVNRLGYSPAFSFKYGKREKEKEKVGVGVEVIYNKVNNLCHSIMSILSTNQRPAFATDAEPLPVLDLVTV